MSYSSSQPVRNFDAFKSLTTPAPTFTPAQQIQFQGQSKSNENPFSYFAPPVSQNQTIPKGIFQLPQTSTNQGGGGCRSCG